MAQPRIAISGFGRIGRMLFRAGFEKLNIVAINDLGSIEQSAHLLKYDSTHGRFPAPIRIDGGDLEVNHKKIKYVSHRNPAEIPWKDLEVDLVLECTGAFKQKEDFMKHIDAGAKRVLVSAPAPGADLTVVYGINHKAYDPDKHHILSNASCTTNCLAPLAKVLNESFGIENGLMTTVHSYTLDQKILDSNHSDLRRARAAAVSMIPTTTGAAKSVGKVLPELAGKVDGFAIRVPTPNVSLVDFTFQSQKAATVELVNKALIAASEKEMKGILGCESEPLVSCDFNGVTLSSVVDLKSTMVSGSGLVKVISWYDNETGFSNRMIDMAKFLQQKGL